MLFLMSWLISVVFIREFLTPLGIFLFNFFDETCCKMSSEVGTDKSCWVSRIPLRHFRSENWETSAWIRVCVTKIKRASCLYGFYSRGLSHWFPRMDGMLDYNNDILRNHGAINSILDSILITKDLLHSVTEFTFGLNFTLLNSLHTHT